MQPNNELIPILPLTRTMSSTLRTNTSSKLKVQRSTFNHSSILGVYWWQLLRPEQFLAILSHSHFITIVQSLCASIKVITLLAQDVNSEPDSGGRLSTGFQSPGWNCLG